MDRMDRKSCGAKGAWMDRMADLLWGGGVVGDLALFPEAVDGAFVA